MHACFMCMHFVICVLSNQVNGHKQSSECGQSQVQTRRPGQTRRSIAQVGGAARLGHGVDGGVGATVGKGHLFGLVALGHC